MKRLSIYTRSLQFRLFYPIVLAVLILSLFGIFSNIYSITMMRGQVIASTENALFPVAKQINERFRNVDISLKQFINSQNMHDLFAQPGSLTFESGKLTIQKDMNAIEQYFDSQFHFFAWAPDQDSFFRSPSLKEDYIIRQKQEVAVKEMLLDKAVGEGTWSILRVEDKNYFWIVYRFEGICLGAWASCDGFLADMNGAKLNDGGFTSFLTHDGLLLVPPVLNNRTDRYDHADEYDNTEIIIRQPLTFGDFTLAKFIPASSIYRNLQVIIVISVCLFIISLIAIALSIKSQRKTIIKPISSMIAGMDEFSRGELMDPLYTEHASTEMEALFNAFNLMTREITDLKIDVYEKELERQNVMNDFLRIQIHPHFYANILNLIYGLAEVGNTVLIQRLSLAMVNYLRHLLNSKDNLVLLKSEVECVRNYMEIQKMRYGDKVMFHLDVEDGLDSFAIPPIIIQTFVENAIKHNITIVSPLEVQLTIASQINHGQCGLVIDLYDNGGGMPAETMHRLQSGEDITKNGRHIGIVNAKKRLLLLYGKSANMEISNSRTSGFHVHIEIPKDDEKQINFMQQ